MTLKITIIIAAVFPFLFLLCPLQGPFFNTQNWYLLLWQQRTNALTWHDASCWIIKSKYGVNPKGTPPLAVFLPRSLETINPIFNIYGIHLWFKVGGCWQDWDPVWLNNHFLKALMCHGVGMIHTSSSWWWCQSLKIMVLICKGAQLIIFCFILTWVLFP